MRTANIFKTEKNEFRVEYVQDGKQAGQQFFRLFDDARMAVDAWMNGKPQGVWL